VHLREGGGDELAGLERVACVKGEDPAVRFRVIGRQLRWLMVAFRAGALLLMAEVIAWIVVLINQS
jgi:hypothetical protein